MRRHVSTTSAVLRIGRAAATTLCYCSTTDKKLPSTSTKPTMDRLRSLLNGGSPAKNTATEYEPLRTSGDDVVEAETTAQGDGDAEGGAGEAYKTAEVPFSWFEYTIFTLVGVAMLWAWYDTFPLPPSPSLAHPTQSRAR